MSALQLVKSEFQGNEISFNEKGWFHATPVAVKYGKDATSWLQQRETVEYISALAKHTMGNSGFLQEFNKISKLDGSSATSRTKLLTLVKKTGFVKTKAGAPENGGGTWLHPKLAVAFSRWLDVNFGVWCDEQIDAILRGNLDQKKARHEANADVNAACNILAAGHAVLACGEIVPSDFSMNQEPTEAIHAFA